MIVHCKKNPFDVYIGRPSEWGNPFKIGTDGTREEVVEKYETWLRDEIKDRNKRKRLLELDGKILGCWCTPPLLCHGMIIEKIIEELKNDIEEIVG